MMMMIMIMIVIVIIICAGDLTRKKNPAGAADVKKNSRKLKKSHPLPPLSTFLMIRL